MTKVLNPQHMQAKIAPEHLRWTQSVHKTLTQGVDMGIPTGTDSTGVYNKFDPGNSSGILIRVGASTSSEIIKWPSSGSLSIQHGLGRQPIGFKIVDKDKPVDVSRTAPPTTSIIQLVPTDSTANVTLYIF